MVSQDKLVWDDNERSAVYKITEAACATQSLPEFYHRVFTILKDVLRIDNFFIALYDEKTDLITFPCYIDEMEPAVPEPHRPGRGLTEYVLRTGRPILVTPKTFADLLRSGEVELVGADGVDWIGVPLTVAGKAIGVMSVQTYSRTDRLSTGELRFLDFVSAQISMVIAQKQIEENLRQEEVKYRTLFEVSKDAVFIETLNGEILDCNESACEMYGVSKSELLAMTVYDIVPDEVAARLPALIDQEISEGSFFTEALGKRKDGTIFPTEVNTKLVDLGGRRMVVVFSRDITAKKLHEQEVETIASMAKALRTAISLSEVLDAILDQVTRLLRAGGASFIMRDEITGDGIKIASRGQLETSSNRRIPNGQGISGWVISSGKVYITNDLQNDPLMFLKENIGGLNALVSMPLSVEDKIIGSLQVARNHQFTDEDLQLFIAISDLAASAIHRAYLYQKGEEQARELTEAYEATLMGWSEAMELRDRETRGHSMRVVDKSVNLARRLLISEEDITQLRRGSLLHDIGKMGIPDSILLKPGPLSEDEWRIMKKHPVMAFQMLAGVPYLKQALDVPLYHHERWDGKGYPYGLREKQIPILARIFAVVDVWDALTTDRPYRPGWSQEETLEYIAQQANKQFDPEIVSGFLEMMKNKGLDDDWDD